MARARVCFSVTIALLLAGAISAQAPRQMEKLGRGVVALNQGEGRVFVSWRLLGSEPDSIAFNVYRTTGSGQPVKLNAAPLTQATCYQDTGVDFSLPVSYTVRAVLDGREQPASAAFKFHAHAPARPYLSIPLQAVPGVPNDASVGDLNGDGEYEIVLKRENGSRDNARSGFTDSTMLEAYTLDGAFLWRIDLGKNIRGGAHYTQFMVYDLDGDGKAEVVCKTADGTIDGQGKGIGDASKNYVNANGMILDGPEFLTIFDGPTGAAMITTDYVPPRGGDGSSWGDSKGNRVDRFLACVAYLDGERPSVVMCRGYYARSTLAAWDWREGKLTLRWFFDSTDGGTAKDGKPNKAYEGQGNHGLSVADVDGDGKDEIVYGACVIDDDGKGLYSTGRGHGDAMHVGDLDPDRPGLEVFQVHEKPSANAGGDFRDARTGERLWGLPSTVDSGRGMAAPIDPRYKGYQCWSRPSNGLYDCYGKKISDRKPSSTNFACWWDGDLSRELLDRSFIKKWNGQDGTETTLLLAEGCSSNNSSKATPALSADLFGDWREEVIWRTLDNKELRIYTTTIPTDHRFYTLMHDPQYRLAIAWQNVAYNQPPHPGFYLGEGMKTPPRPNIRLAEPKTTP